MSETATYRPMAEQYIDHMINNPAWSELGDIWQVKIAPVGQTSQRIEDIFALSGSAWNLRGGAEVPEGYAERWNMKIPDDIKAMDEPDNKTGKEILAATYELGGIEGIPFGAVDLSARVVLGAAAQACTQRTMFGLGYEPRPLPAKSTVAPVLDRLGHLGADMDEATAHYGPLVTIGSRRKLSEAERTQVDAIMPESLRDGRDEWTEADVLYGAAHWILSSEGNVTEYAHEAQAVGFDAKSPGVIRYLVGKHQTAITLEVPAPANPLDDPKRNRANTDEGFQMLGATQGGLLGPDERVGVVTNSIYVPFQRASFLNYVTQNHGARPAMVSFSAPSVGITRKASAAVAELRSTAKKLYEFKSGKVVSNR